MADNTSKEMLSVLKEIRELLRPVADAYEGEYAKRQAIRAKLSTEKRKQAWGLADGTRSQRDIARAVSMDPGETSRFFKGLREIAALTDDPKPKRGMEMTV